jgi:hypothetical protein
MKRVRVTATATGASDAIVVDQYNGEFNLGLYLTTTGSAAGTIQVSADLDMDGVSTPTWIDTSLSTTGDNKVLNTTIPCRAVRMNVTDDTGGLTLTVVQSGRD